jgi:hypothetical protein
MIFFLCGPGKQGRITLFFHDPCRKKKNHTIRDIHLVYPLMHSRRDQPKYLKDKGFNKNMTREEIIDNIMNKGLIY